MPHFIVTILLEQWPFYELSKYEEIQAKVLDRERPYIDERLRQRGYIERSLIEIMERMWKHKPKNRPSIFEVVAFLTHVQETLNANVSRPDI